MTGVPTRGPAFAPCPTQGGSPGRYAGGQGARRCDLVTQAVRALLSSAMSATLGMPGPPYTREITKQNGAGITKLRARRSRTPCRRRPT